MKSNQREFSWGVAISAFQTEGAYDHDGKGPSIWDEFTIRGKKARNKQHAMHSCMFYEKFEDDIALLSSMGIPNFRFSISWPRIFPNGSGIVNRKGVDFYRRVLDCCHQHGIKPWVTLFHWDYPLKLQHRGGWTNRDSIGWFSEYVYRCVHEFGDSIENWMVMNEPVVFTGAGHFLGVHAPGLRGISNFLSAVHHVALSQAAGVRIIKSDLPKANVGTTFSCSHLIPNSNSEEDRLATTRADALLNRLFVEPLIGRGYPFTDFPALRRIERFFKPDDTLNLYAPVDFIGIQHYTREVISSNRWIPFIGAKIIPAVKRKVYHTAMNWEVYPNGIYAMIRKYSSYPEIKELIITENGAAFEDLMVNDKINDVNRIAYLRDYIEQMERARCEGFPVNGYFIWSFMDNFEWTEGYAPRFGIVHVDFESMKRTVKESGRWYSEFIKSRTAIATLMKDESGINNPYPAGL